MTYALYEGIVEAVTDFEHVIVKIPDSSIRASEAIVIRVSLVVWESLLAAGREVLDALANQAKLINSRTDKTTVIVFPVGAQLAGRRHSSSIDIWPRKLFVPGSINPAPVPATTIEVEAIRSQDLSDLLEGARSRCVMCSSSNHHFELPSGAHSSQFLRLAEAFEDLDTVDRAAYWLALALVNPLEMNPRPKTVSLVVDNPSMLILGVRTEAILNMSLNLHCMPSYPADVVTSKAIDDLLSSLAGESEDIVVVISVASTGKLGSFLDDWSRRRQNASARPIALYGTQSLLGLDAMCSLKLPDYRHFNADEVCQLCAAGSEAVAIHGSTYLVGYRPTKPIALPPKFFRAQKDFITKFGNVPGALRVHYDDPNELAQRHHAYYVDVLSLLSDELFVKELRNKFSDLNPVPDLVICPPHAAATRIAEIAGETLNCNFFVLEPPLSSGSVDFKMAAASAKTLLIVDDVYITGARLDQFNRAIRQDSALVANLSSAYFFTVLATPSSQEDYDRSTVGLTTNHEDCLRKLDHLYRFLLPGWHGSTDCPWCRERTMLESLLATSDGIDDPLEDRLSELRNTAVGLSANCFAISAIGTLLPNLGAGSQVLQEGATPLQLAFACASATQQIRSAELEPLNPKSFPAPRFLAERVFSKNFSERLLWLALLRSLKSSELEGPLKRYLTSIALGIDDEQGKPYLIRELAIAALDGKFDAVDHRLMDFFDGAGLEWTRVVGAGYVSPPPKAQYPIRVETIASRISPWGVIRHKVRSCLRSTLERFG